MPKVNERKVVLIAALDWGLGHATRCIPLIRYMIQLDFEVIIAAEGAQAALLRQEFPGLRMVLLKGYRLKYGRSESGTLVKILAQIPKILTAIKSEKRWLAGFLRNNQVDFIISDNRYGFRHPEVPSAFITHQLRIKSPWGRLSEKILRQLNYRFIRKFDECWIPDYPGEENLGGELSHPSRLPPVPVKYLGALTRFQNTGGRQTNDLLILLSGPEPQRSILEDIMLEELKDYTGKAVLLRGLPGGRHPLPEGRHSLPDFAGIRFYNHLPTHRLNELINESAVVLSRPGYTTVMDMAALGKKCIFIPTPGQTEQQYLAETLGRKSYCLYFKQEVFSLKQALEEIRTAGLQPFGLPETGGGFMDAISCFAQKEKRPVPGSRCP